MKRAIRAVSFVAAMLTATMAITLTLPAPPSHAAGLLGEDFTDDYVLTDLGAPEGVPAPFGGVTIKHDDPDTLLIGGSANNSTGAIYAVPLERDPLTHEITGFAGPATHFADAPYIDGGLAYAPGSEVLFYTAYPHNQIGQILPGETAPAKIDDVTPLGIESSVGSLIFTPSYAPGAGMLRVASYNGSELYSLDYTAQPDGTYELSATTEPAHALPDFFGPEGIAYVPIASPAFATQSMLITSYNLGKVSAFEMDANGLPIVSTEREFVSSLSGAEGAHVDVLSGGFIFSTFSSSTSNVVVVNGLQSTAIAPEIVTDALPQGTVGSAYTSSVEVTGDPVPTVTLTGDLPPGIIFSEATRQFSGAPTEAGTFTFAITAVNGAGSDSQAFTITVIPDPAEVEPDEPPVAPEPEPEPVTDPQPPVLVETGSPGGHALNFTACVAAACR